MSPTVSVDVTGAPVPLPAHPPLVTGALWVEARPDLRRLHVLAGDVLGALGKRRDLAGKGRNQQDDVRHAVAWTTAHGVTDLVITEAQRLHPLLLHGLITVAGDVGSKLWLVHRPQREDAFVRGLTRRGATHADLSDVPLPVAAPEAPMAAPVELPGVPAEEFTTFRHSCQQALPADDAARVGAHFTATTGRCDAVLREAGATRATVADLLHRLLNPGPGDAQLIVELRALQTAAWHHDVYAKIDLPRLLHSEERRRVPTAEADAALAAYRQPHRAITVNLTRAGRDLTDITTVRLRDPADDGSVLHVADERVTVGEHTARAVRAQRQLRLAAGAGPDDLLLPYSAKALAKVLTEAATDLGIHVHGRRAELDRWRSAVLDG